MLHITYIFQHVDQNQSNQNGTKNGAGRTIALVSKSKRARIQRIEDTAPTETIDITQVWQNVYQGGSGNLSQNELN